MEHSEALNDVHIAVNVFDSHDDSDSGSIISAIEKIMGNALKANKLYFFVPMAFGFVLAKKIGIVKLPSEFYLLNKNQEKVSFPLAQEHYFSAALTLAYEHFENGWSEQLSKEKYESVVTHSAEINAVNKALNEGADVAGGSFQASIVSGILAEEYE